MNKPVDRIIAINPGTRYLGLAVLYGSDLREWGMKVVQGRSVNEKVKYINGIVTELAGRYGATLLAMKRLHPSRCSAALLKMTASLRDARWSEDITLREYSIGDVMKTLSLPGSANKQDLMEEVAVRFPFLSSELEREKRSKQSYLMRMFEAVAVGISCFQNEDLSQRKVGVKREATNRHAQEQQRNQDSCHRSGDEEHRIRTAR